MGKWFRRPTHDIVSDALRSIPPVTIYDPHPDADDEYHEAIQSFRPEQVNTGLHAAGKRPDTEIYVRRSTTIPWLVALSRPSVNSPDNRIEDWFHA